MFHIFIMSLYAKRFLFFWAISFVFAIAGYYILWVLMPEHYVFGAPYRMYLYHWQYPSSFIIIPCFFYGMIVPIFVNSFPKQSIVIRILITGCIVVATILMSSPLGGMLWHYYDMKAGFFPQNWEHIMIRQGFEWGLEVGWYIIVLSIPYNIIGIILCYFLTQWGSFFLKK